MADNHLMGTLLILIVVGVNPQEHALTKGMVFLQQGNILMTTSQWIVVVDITLEAYETQFNNIQTHLTSLQSVIDGATRRKDDPMRSLWTLAATELENLQHMLIDYRKEYNELKSLITLDNKIRRKRGVIDFGGEILKFLFGTATSGDIESLNKRVDNVETNQKKIVHLLELQATVLNQTLIAVKDNRQYIQLLMTRQEYLEKTLRSYSYSFFVGTALRYVEGAIAE